MERDKGIDYEEKRLPKLPIADLKKSNWKIF